MCAEALRHGDPEPTPDCAHCGLPVPAGRATFCCDACETVWHAIHTCGLEQYYALREAGSADPKPARWTGKTYAELDDPSYQTRACAPAPGGLRRTDLFLEGVHCAACVWLVERLPRLHPGLISVSLDLPRARARVVWDPQATPLSAIARRLDGFGYAPHPFRGTAAAERARREDRALLVRIGIAGALAGNVMAIAFALYGGILNGIEPAYAMLFRWTSLLLAFPAILGCGSVFFRGAWGALRTRTLHMDVPIALGLTAGLLQGAVNTVRGTGQVYFETLCTLVFLLLVGRFLQRRQQRKAADATEMLAALAPATARLVEGETTRDVAIETLLPGMLVEVRAGETLPADGVVTAGQSDLDTALLTGEARPVAVKRGDAVHAGTLNLAALLRVRVEKAGEATRVGRLLHLVEESARRRAPIVQTADRIAGWFVAVVLALAALTAALWWSRGPAAALDHAIALLIVTCPCALGLATPLALSAAVGQAARAGLLIKGADVLEALTRGGRLWLDKTGTVTSGDLRVLAGEGDLEAWALAAALEAHSAHPVARALVAAVPGQVPAGEAVETQGGGVRGRVRGREVAVGSPAYIGERATVPSRCAALAESWSAQGHTAVMVAVDGTVRAVAALGDRLRDEASSAVERLRARGFRPGLLSGDHPGAVAAVAERLGISQEDVRGAVSPERKLEIVSADRPVVMVGDGVNDAAALAAAGVGIAVHGGAEAALAAADVYVARAGIDAVVQLVEGAHRALAVVRRNLVFSLLYNVAGVALAMTGVLDPVVAAVLMPIASLTVIVSSYRARTFSPCR